MYRPILIACFATLLATLSLYLWRIVFKNSDLAALALLPLAAVIATGFWALSLPLWKARIHIALRQESSWKKWMTGRIRAAVLSVGFTILSVILLAWQALRISASEAALMAALFFLSTLAYCFAQSVLLRHFHQPFARTFATSLATWFVAIPATIGIAFFVWALMTIPGEFLNASFQEALQIGRSNLPSRGGWLTTILSVPFGYEAAKLWMVVQLRDYSVFAWLFSLDAAVFSFILCRTAITVAHFIEDHVLQIPHNSAPRETV